VAGRARRLAGLLPNYTRIAWWGLVSPRLAEREPLLVVQGVVRSERGLLLSVRGDLRGWELPGGGPRPGEPPEAALRRELREETGLEVEVGRHVGDYVRSGFRPHTARVHECRAISGELHPSAESPRLRWFDPSALPGTLFPWYRAPIEDALNGDSDPVERHEVHGVGTVLAAMAIDVRMRWSDDRAGIR
jgi:8-oxo-dGTP diphosphatase